MITIRAIEETDAEAFLSLGLRLDAETTFMMLEPGERNQDVDAQRARIAGILASDDERIWVAEHDGELVGFLEVYGGMFRRNRHSAYIVIGVLQSFAGQGIGTRLFATLESWAHERRIHRLELTVMVHNGRAIRLYQKMGFIIEGTKKHSLFVDGAFVDEYSMAKLLPLPDALGIQET
ncbi:MAG: GNAT family N-acetyltransferase [Caldilineaceae bacterium]|nr:GNAT family N-acetyltransferase [Caldilineaceae bacterium]